MGEAANLVRTNVLIHLECSGNIEIITAILLTVLCSFRRLRFLHLKKLIESSRVPDAARCPESYVSATFEASAIATRLLASSNLVSGAAEQIEDSCSFVKFPFQLAGSHFPRNVFQAPMTPVVRFVTRREIPYGLLKAVLKCASSMVKAAKKGSMFLSESNLRLVQLNA